MLLGNENNRKKYIKDEEDRQKFREICINAYGIKPSIDGLRQFLKGEEWKSNTHLVNIINNQRILSNFYRSEILNEDADHINSTQSPKIP